MKTINKDYLYTEEWADMSSLVLPDSSLYLYATDPETRSNYCVSKLLANNSAINFIELEIDDEDSMNVKGDHNKLPLNSRTQIGDFLRTYSPDIIYLDVTGMSCRLAAPLIRCAILDGFDVRVVYAEPLEYKLPEFQNEGINKDLSGCVKGVKSLPGFTKVFRMCKEDPLFVVLLGFEGGRFTYLVANQQPAAENIRPVIGVPGYRMEYPFVSYWGNRVTLKTTRSWEHVEYAEANSIVDAFFVLDKIWNENHKPYMLIAPIGTKPHAIGSILYAIKNDSRVELIYDNPIQSRNRVDGVGRILVCNVTKLFNEN